MKLTLIFGPMKSGKSSELIKRFKSLDSSGKKKKKSFGVFQSVKNIRDEQVQSRDGSWIESRKILKISEIPLNKYDVIGIDEIHMFSSDNTVFVKKLLNSGTEVITSGLMTDYQGRMFDFVRGLFELDPGEVIQKRLLCEFCGEQDAVHTQVLRSGKAMTEGLPPSIPDNGDYDYVAACQRCFVFPGKA